MFKIAFGFILSLLSMGAFVIILITGEQVPLSVDAALASLLLCMSGMWLGVTVVARA